MNENEKMEPEQVQTSAQTPETSGETLTSSPAPAAEETADAVEVETCVETESPALDIEEAAEKQKLAEIHSLSKEQLVARIKEILEGDDMHAHKEVTFMKQAFFNIRKREGEEELARFVEEGNPLENFSASPCELENEFKDLLAEFKTRRAAFLEKDEEVRQENLAKKLHAIDGIKAIMEDVDNINRNYQEFQRLQQEFKDIKDIPQQAETEVWKQYQTVVEQFYDLLKLNKELRDLDFKKNLEAKRELVEQAKALAELPDVVEASRRLQELHNRWREIGPVAKDIREEIWEEFRGASTVVNRRHQEFYEQRKANEQKNEEAKTRLCEEMEALPIAECKTFADWDKMTEKIKELQASWKQLGFASRKSNNALFARFRKSIDDFFAKKSEFYQKTREELKENLRKKIELCEKAEELAASENLSEAVKALREMQEEWKTIGSVDRRQSDIVWRRFMKACNSAFDRRKKEADSRRNEEKANLTVKTRIVADLKAILEETEESGDSIRRMRALQDEWRQTGYVPYAKKEQLNDEYFDLVRKLSDKLNLAERRRERNTRISTNSNLSPRDQILERIRIKTNDLHTYENNMGFFNVKSAAGNSMVKELERKIQRIKTEISDLEDKLAELDSAEQ